MSAQDTSSTSSPLALPTPSDVLKETENVTVNGTQTFKFDKLGPVVVNKDGTLSRIANWEEMTPIEKERTLRVLVARNQVRLVSQETQEDESSEDRLSILTRSDV